MDKLPTELIIDLMAKMPYQDMLNMIRINKKYNGIYDENIEAIYRRRLQNDFGCIENSEDIYKILIKSQKEYDDYCDEKVLIENKECKNLLSNLVKINKIKNNDKKTKMIMALYYNIKNCLDYLEKKDPGIKKTIQSIYENLDFQVRTSKTISESIKKQWVKFYLKVSF